MKGISKKLVGFLLIGLMLTPTVFVSAQTTEQTVLMTQLEAQIASLKAQLNSLQAQLRTAKKTSLATTTATPTPVAVVGVYTFNRSLYYGLKGDDVTKLQEFLKQFPEVYDGEVTGYFGKLTEKAVRKYQKKYGIDQTGYFGPKTREHAHGNKGKHENNDDKVTVCHLGRTLSIDDDALATHLAHGDTQGTCSTTPPTDTTAPVISNTSSNPSSASAVISWTTNEGATSVVKYSTTSPVLSASNMLTVENTSITTAHSLTLSGLSANTVYYYVVISRDAAGNTVTGTQATFTTLVTPDTTAPVISSVSATTTTSTAIITWSTDEAATSIVKYATSSPALSASNLLTFENTALVTSHNVTLSGLSGSTTYYYVPISKDAATNTATGTQASFTTQ